MNILDIYKKYQIMPNLAEHQLKVTGVAEFIIHNSSLILDRNEVVAACLLHDMGNILKFDLTKTNSILKLNIDVEFWQKVKEEYRQKYGADEHRAALVIAREVRATERVIELIDCIGFNNDMGNAETKDFGKKICAYSDMRVGPLGVISLEERMADLRVRYDNKFHMMGGDEQARSEFENGLREIERQIFEHSKVKASDITEDSIAPVADKLKAFEI